MSQTFKFCSECGTPLDEGTRFCGECGMKLSGFAGRDQNEARKEKASNPQTQWPESEIISEEYGAEKAKQSTSDQEKENRNTRPPQKRLTRIVIWVFVTAFLIGGMALVVLILAEEIAPGYVNALAFSPDEKKLLSAGPDSYLQLWDLDSNTSTSRLKIGNGIIKALAWSSDNNFIALAINDQIRLYRLPDLKPFLTVPVVADEIRALCFDPDGISLYSVTNRLGVSVWDFQAGKRLGGIPDLSDRLLGDAGFSGDCKRIVALESTTSQSAQAGYQTIHEALMVYQRINMETLLAIPFEDFGEKPDVMGLNFKGSIVLGIDASRAQIWNVNSGKKQESSLNYFYSTSMAIGRRNNLFAVGGSSGQINLHDRNGNYLTTLQHSTTLGLALLPLRH